MKRLTPAAALATLLLTVAAATGARSQTAPSVAETPNVVTAPASASTPAAAAPPPHLRDAEYLLTILPHATLNVYGENKQNRPFIVWDADHPAARTVCSTFASLLLAHTYHKTPEQMRAWLHSTTPNADTVHDAIAAGKGFTCLHRVADLQPGDFLAIKYFDGSKDTGHVMLVDAAPVPWTASAPVIPGTTQWAVAVIDSSASGHGPVDTRHRPDGSFSGGIGRGVCRLYADTAGKIVGYTWSTATKSKYYTDPGRDLIAGRVAPTQ